MLQSMYTGDSVDTEVNGVTTRSIYLRRGLRQGCSLSPMLFNLYISDMGHDLMLSTEGFLLFSGIVVPSLMFADDLFLVARSSLGLQRLLILVQTHAFELKLDISVEKSQVISPEAGESWDILLTDGTSASLKQVLQYKYLGIETFSTVYKTHSAKQKKCVETAKRYMYACIHLARSSADPVRLAVTTWENIAIPSIMYGCESVIFSESKLLELEKIQSQVAKWILGVPRSSANICAQTELGFKPFKLLIYRQQLGFYFRVLSLNSDRWVSLAMRCHLDNSWSSPYVDYICKLRGEVSLYDPSPSRNYLEQHLNQWFLNRINDQILSKSLPCIEPLTCFRKERYAYSHKYMGSIASFRLSNAGLGNRFALQGLPRLGFCPRCGVHFRMDEVHVVVQCASMGSIREELGLSTFLEKCEGYSSERKYFLYVNGLDEYGNWTSAGNYESRGFILNRMRSAWINLIKEN